jgi:hypothetical protein
MAETHLSIDVANEKFRKLERRNNYTTPKSFLELISFYKTYCWKTKKGKLIDKSKDIPLVCKFWLKPRAKSKDFKSNSKLRWLRSKSKDKRLKF